MRELLDDMERGLTDLLQMGTLELYFNEFLY